MPDSSRASSPAPPSPRRYDPPRLVRGVALIGALGGVFTVISILLPHLDDRYDSEFIVVGCVMFVLGVGLYAWGRSRMVGAMSVHVSTLVMSLPILALAWFNMRDLGGVQAVFLLILLGISASIGPAWWSVVFMALQSAGYAVVLATADAGGTFDRQGQWIVVTMGLVVCLAYNGMVRRELEVATKLEHQRDAEREQERILHAERLERLNEELQQTSELKSQFVAMASHELRTPLTAIEGFATTLQYRWDELNEKDKRSFVDVIDLQAQRLGRLVADLLTLSRIESGRLVPHPSTVSVHDAIRRAVRTFEDFDVDVDAPEDLRVEVDPDHFQQVLVNFLGNARAYGEPPFRVVARAEGDSVDVAVIDSGPGVAPSFVPELFDRFARAPVSERNDGTSGTGLGLSIVEGLAESNRGSAWYEPNQPSGARFSIRLPRSD